MMYSAQAVANQLGVSKQTIILWEKLGKTGKAKRLPNGHRYYMEEDVALLKENTFIRK